MRRRATHLPVFPGMPKSQNIDRGPLNFVADFVASRQNAAYLTGIELFRPFSNSRMPQQSRGRVHQRLYRESSGGRTGWSQKFVKAFKVG